MTETYKERVMRRTKDAGNSICVGLDPVMGKIPGNGTPQERIKRFYGEMLEAMVRSGTFPAAIKPNIAYYEAQGIECLDVLRNLIRDFRSQGVLAILDAKRGDIASTSRAYAQMAFEVFSADALTVSPYMGLDSIRPFQEASQGQGIYVLVRTSNSGAGDFQDLPVQWNGKEGPLYQRVAEKVAEWNDGNLGAVVGATAPVELEKLIRFWKERQADIPLLIPGVAVHGVAGGQLGTLAEVLRAIRRAGGDAGMHLINSSSGINYAYEKFTGLGPAEASLAALKEMIEEQLAN